MELHWLLPIRMKILFTYSCLFLTLLPIPLYFIPCTFIPLFLEHAPIGVKTHMQSSTIRCNLIPPFPFVYFISLRYALLHNHFMQFFIAWISFPHVSVSVCVCYCIYLCFSLCLFQVTFATISI